MQAIFDPKLLRRSPARVKRVRRWIRALKSGQFKQGKGVLYRAGVTKKDDKFCCLGVMLIVEHFKVNQDDLKEAREHGGIVEIDDSDTMPFPKACRMFGLLSEDDYHGAGLLAGWNDNMRPTRSNTFVHKYTFKMIATRLDKALKEALKS